MQQPKRQRIASSEYYLYSRSLQALPKPNCVCFYNGKAEQPERQVLRLSDAFGGEADIEVKVTMLEHQLRQEPGVDGSVPAVAGVRMAGG